MSRPGDYKAISAWHAGSNLVFISQLQEKAARENAPTDSVFYKEDRGWVTVRDIEPQATLRRLANAGVVEAKSIIDERNSITDPKTPSEWRSFVLGDNCTSAWVRFFVDEHKTKVEYIHVDKPKTVDLIDEYGESLMISRDGSAVYIGNHS